MFNDFRRFVLCGEIFRLKIYRMIQFHPDTVGAMDGIATAVGAGERGVVGNCDRFTVGAFDYSCDDIPQCMMAPNRTVLAIGVGGSDIQTTAFRCGGCQRQEPVAAVDVQIFCDRTDFMCGVKIRVPVHVMVGTLIPRVNPFGNAAQIVLISAFTVDDFSEESLADHVQDSKFTLAIAAVFQHHAGRTGLFIGTDKVPALAD